MSDDRTPRLVKSTAGMIFRILGWIMLLIGFSVLAVFILPNLKDKLGLWIGSMVALYLSLGSIVQGVILLGLAELSDALVTSARYSQLTHGIIQDRLLYDQRERRKEPPSRP